MPTIILFLLVYLNFIAQLLIQNLIIQLITIFAPVEANLAVSDDQLNSHT